MTGATASATIKKPAWEIWLWSAMLALALVLMLKSDLDRLNRVAGLSREGSPPPARDPGSPTGYVLGQRHFLGLHERGETYRWIAATQEFVANGAFAATTYHADSIPEGRPQLMPRLYTAWLAAVSWGLHVVTGDPTAIAAERAALWEPVVTHVLALAFVVTFMGRRHGPAGAGLAGLFFVLFPPVAGQFLPGTLTPRTWALLLAAYALALHVPRNGDEAKSPAFGVIAALAAGLTLWLDPAFGFPAVLIIAAIGMVAGRMQPANLPVFRWSLLGAIFTLAAWLIDRSPWDPAAGELRYVHPLYALAWLGLGVGLDGWQERPASPTRRKWRIVKPASALALLAPLAYSQLEHGYKGWLYAAATMRRLTSLDETQVFDTALGWLAGASPAEIAFLAAPLLGAGVLLVLLWRKRSRQDGTRAAEPVAVVLFTGLLVLAFFRVRWVVPASLVALPLLGSLVTSGSVNLRRGFGFVTAVLLLGLFGWGATRPARDAGPGRADLEVLIHRHFAHWLGSHTPGQKVAVLAPPELSDSLVFHGGSRVLMSTAWESYPGQVAASRILSAPEATEAEAVLQNRGITHVILTSWDPVLPLLVKEPDTKGKDTLHARLQRWVLPRYLRPIPYRMPAVPGYQSQQLALFKVTPPQDEALSLGRLVEYFVEMERAEPARLAAQALAESFPDDPNAAIARALVHVREGNQVGFERELAHLAADVEADRVSLAWDRRVQRAIVLALGRRHELARRETEGCLAAATTEDLLELTPLQAYRLGVLARGFGLAFPETAQADLVASLGAEYHTAPNVPAAR